MPADNVSTQILSFRSGSTGELPEIVVACTEVRSPMSTAPVKACVVQVLRQRVHTPKLLEPSAADASEVLQVQ